MTNKDYLGKDHVIRILDLRDSPWVDGPGRTILDCAESLENNKYHFIIGSFSGGVHKTNEYMEEGIRRGLEVISIPEKSAFDWRVIPFILKIIDRHRIDLIHTHDFRSNVMGLICAKIRRIPIITTVHGWIANDFKGRLYCSVDKFALKFFKHIIAVSERTRRIVLNTGVPVEKTTIINNALILENYQIEPDKRDYRKELNVNNDTTLIANIGRLSPEKGQLEFLQAACEVIKQNKNVKFILIGKGPDESKLKKFVEEKDISDYVIFCGYRNDMINIYNSIDLVVQSSYTEGMPNVILEALLMRRPVIATDVGGTSEIIIENVNGVLIEPGMVIQLAQKINDFINNKKKYKRQAQKGRNHIIDHFDHNKRVEKLSQIYNTLTKF